MILSEALRSLGANISTTVAATVTVLIGMFLLGLFIALGTWVLSWSDHVKKQLVVKVYFSQSATQQEMNAVARRLHVNTDIKKYTFISKAQALANMQKRYPQLTANLVSNPLPASFEIVPKKGELVDAIAASLQPLPAGVDKVDYGKSTAQKVLKVAKVISLVFLVMVVVLVGASTLLIANTIRLSIFSRRREIEVMKLVGATNWLVRGPFMLEGLICGFGGAVIAIILLLLGREFALPAVLSHGLNAGSDVTAIPFGLNAALLLAAGLLLGAAGSGITMRKFLKV